MRSRWVREAAAAGVTEREELGRQWDIMGQFMTHLFLSRTQTHKWNCILSQRERVLTEQSKKNMLNMLKMRTQPEFYTFVKRADFFTSCHVSCHLFNKNTSLIKYNTLCLLL